MDALDALLPFHWRIAIATGEGNGRRSRMNLAEEGCQLVTSLRR